MSESTTRFSLPFILPGQAQKEVFHNEALAILDCVLCPVAEGPPQTNPPFAPSPGQSWIVGAGATGDWSGRESTIATWTEGGWRFLPPVAGMLVWNRLAGCWMHWSGNRWMIGDMPMTAVVIGGKKVVGARQPAVPSVSGGTIIDEEARAAIAAITAALMSHGLTD